MECGFEPSLCEWFRCNRCGERNDSCSGAIGSKSEELYGVIAE